MDPDSLSIVSKRAQSGIYILGKLIIVHPKKLEIILSGYRKRCRVKSWDRPSKFEISIPSFSVSSSLKLGKRLSPN